MTTENTNIILDVQNLTAGYGDKAILENFNLQVNKGEVVAVTGPNGCGKSTLLKSIYQLCKIESGSILYKGENLNDKTPEHVKSLSIAYFMQKNAIFTHLKVRDNIILSLNGISPAEKKFRIEEISANFPDMSNWMNKTAGLLSGGQRQQLAMAMLISQNADFWLLDEPTAGLDQEKTTYFVNMIRKEQIKKNIAIIIVEHKMNVISDLATRIIKL
jgi:ABC-type branched-subunit amino acid transport system ATPase component